MNRFKKFTAFFAFALMILGLPVIASAQWRDNRRNDDDYYRNTTVNTRALKSTIKNLNNRSKQFERRVDRELDRSRYNNRRGEDRLNDMASRFADAARDLDRRFDGKRDLRDSSSEARRVLELGSQLERALSRANFSHNVQNEWNRIRQDLSQIANAYRYNDRNRRDDRRGGFPFPF